MKENQTLSESPLRSQGFRMRPLLFGLFLWTLALILSLKTGAVADISWELIWEVRLPRVLLASGIGMGLAVSGAVLQALFSNPLCEPYTLGISSGAALGAVLGSSLGLETSMSGLTGSAFVGALVFCGVLLLLTFRGAGSTSVLLLTGVILGFLGNSLLTLWIALTDTQGLQGALVWLFGDLSRARMNGVILTLVSLVFLVFSLWRESRSLDALLVGEEMATAVGVDVPRVRRRIMVYSSLIVGLCVSAGGIIGFIGLITPHFVRRSVGSTHSLLIPLCAIWGASALMLADGASRVLARPFELPVGVVSALIGSPLFLWVMLKRKGGQYES
jgi:iron complex transport system permease protein